MPTVSSMATAIDYVSLLLICTGFLSEAEYNDLATPTTEICRSSNAQLLAGVGMSLISFKAFLSLFL